MRRLRRDTFSHSFFSRFGESGGSDNVSCSTSGISKENPQGSEDPNVKTALFAAAVESEAAALNRDDGWASRLF